MLRPPGMTCLDRDQRDRSLRPRPAAADPSGVDSEVDQLERAPLIVRGELRIAGLPPDGARLEEAVGKLALRLELGRRRKLLVVSEHDHARPMLRAFDFVCLD